MLNLKKLRSENHLNKVVRQARQQKDRAVAFLVTSPWDPQSNLIKKELHEAWEGIEQEFDFYEIDYFELPHAYCIFKTRTPSLVCVLGKKTVVLDNPMSIRIEMDLDTLGVPRKP
jgi:hypothetical protein